MCIDRMMLAPINVAPQSNDGQCIAVKQRGWDLSWSINWLFRADDRLQSTTGALEQEVSLETDMCLLYPCL